MILLSFGFIHIVARRNLRRLAPILADAQRTDQRITNAEILDAARSRTSLKQSWLIAVAFGSISLLALGALVFDANLKHALFSDVQSIAPTIQMVLFATLAAINFRVALKKSDQQEPLSPGKPSILARRPRQVVLGSALALLGLAVIIALVGVRREFSDYTQGLRYEAKGEHDSAIASFSRAIEAYPGDPAAYASRAEIYRAKGEHDLAIADLSRLIELRPEGADAYISRGRSFEAKGDRAHAIADFGKAIGIEPKRAIAYYWRSRSREATGDRDGAIADLSAALEINPKDTASFIARARIFDAKGERERAMADFATAISLDPRHSFAHFWRGLSLAARGDHAGAIADFTKALEFHPKDHHIYSSRGRSYEAKGEVGLAIADFTKAIEYKPDYAFAYRQRASAYANKGDRRQRHRRLHPDHRAHAEGCLRLRQPWRDLRGQERARSRHRRPHEGPRARSEKQVGIQQQGGQLCRHRCARSRHLRLPGCPGAAGRDRRRSPMAGPGAWAHRTPERDQPVRANGEVTQAKAGVGRAVAPVLRLDALSGPLRRPRERPACRFRPTAGFNLRRPPGD